MRTTRAKSTAGAPVALVTAEVLPVPDHETGMVRDALAELGIEATIVAWTAAVDWAAHELVVCCTPWDYIDHVAEFCAWVRTVETVARLENSAEIVIWNAHKSYMIDLADARVPVVPTQVVARDDDVGSALAGYADDELLVIKPAVSGGALGAERLAAASPAAAAHLARLAAEGDVLVQPFLPQVSDGEISLVYFDGQLSHAVRKVPAVGDYRVHEYYGGTVQRHAPSAAEQQVAEQVLAATPGPTTYARIDMVDGVRGPLVMEAELIDPELFLLHDPLSVDRFARALTDRIPNPGGTG